MRVTKTITAAVAVLLLTGCRTTAAVIEPPADSPASALAPSAPLPEVGAALRETTASDQEQTASGSKHARHGHHAHSTGGGHGH